MGVTDLAGWAAGKRFKLCAVTGVAASAGVALAITPIANLPMAPSVSLFTICMTTSLIATCITSVLLGAQARAHRSYSQAVLAIGYAFTSATMLTFLLLYPSVFGHLPRELEVSEQTPLRLFMLWHFSFIGAVFAYHLVGWSHPSGVGWRGGRQFLRRVRYVAFGGWVVLVATAGWGSHLPLGSVGNTLTRAGRGAILAVALLGFVAMLMPLYKQRFDKLLDVCLSTACAATVIDLYLIFVAPTRFSLGWYFSRFNIVVMSSTLLFVLLWQTAKMYGHLSASASRFKDEAYLDGLTGIPNRRAFDQELSLRLARVAGGGPAFSLALVDIDHFKAFNDSHGHLAGDRCLARVAAALAAAIRLPSDFVARYGGDEFAVIVGDVAPPGAAIVFERLRSFVERASIAAGENVATVSVGGTSLLSGDDAFRFVNRADRLLYVAKSNGRNCVEFVDGSESQEEQIVAS